MANEFGTNNALEVTTIDTLKEYTKGVIRELPPFEDGQPFVARLKRPSLMAMVKKGKIPNKLLSSANALFDGDSNALFDGDNADTMQELLEIMDIVCDATFAEPTYQEIKEAGIELTDEQMMFVFQYSQGGIDSLDSFRAE